MSQYFDNDSTIKSERKTIYYRINDVTFSLFSDNGVFAKEGLDFGSRTLIEEAMKDGLKGKILDIGCGYGIIGITIGYFNKDLDLTMSDVNLRALDLAKENANKYGIKCNIIESNMYENIGCDYDVILANPPIRAGKDIVNGIILGAYDHLNKGGKLLAVMRKDQGAPSAKKRLEETFGNCEIIKRNKGYYILKSTK